jgi:branched-subunit amino acid transport protein
VLLSLVRILPPASLLGQFESEFYSGYLTLADLWHALVTIFPAANKTSSILIDTPLSYWEISLYVGLAGGIFLLYFGVWRWLRPTGERAAYQSLALPVLGLVVLSMGQIYNLLRQLPIPLLDGERVSTRLISLPFVFICIFAAIHFQDWLNQPKQNKSLVYLVTVAGIIIGVNDLWQNYRVWRVPAAMLNFKEKVFDPRLWTVANHTDPVYLGLIWGGAALSLVSLGVLVFFTWRSHHAKRTD